MALLGREREAAEVCAAGRQLGDFTIGKYRAQAMSDNPVYLAQHERPYEGMRKAGVPVR